MVGEATFLTFTSVDVGGAIEACRLGDVRRHRLLTLSSTVVT